MLAVHSDGYCPAVRYVFLPYTLGAWHFVLVGVFQHASLAQDVLDHRLNTRTCYINPVSAFIYWNMLVIWQIPSQAQLRRS